MTQNHKHRQSKSPLAWVQAVVANERGEIFELDGYAAVGQSGSTLLPLKAKECWPMPHGGELMRLPDRHPLVYDIQAQQLAVLRENPYEPNQPLFPVAAFNSPGYVNQYACAYEESPQATLLPLFSYGAVGWTAGEFVTPLIRVDRENRQDLRQMPVQKVQQQVKAMRRRLPDNRLARHLENCALNYGCPAGKNFFLGRYEAPLPTSQSCNARCLGCLSWQPEKQISHSQDRIGFTPTPQEITQVALTHIKRVNHAVVSFGQGCEGDPLLAAQAISPAIRAIRAETADGTINLNTNASMPDIVAQLCEDGLDSMRVSLNSANPIHYERYFRPRDYHFGDVLESIRRAGEAGVHVALNYLNCPGFTDSPREIEALTQVLRDYPIHMIQWRNLNYDPQHYWRTMGDTQDLGRPLGMQALLTRLRNRFPLLRYGYFNPPKESFNPHAMDRNKGPA